MNSYDESQSQRTEQIKYDKNNFFLDYKRTVWDAKYGDTDEMPQVEQWFDATGKAKSNTMIHDSQGGNEDDDLVVAQVKQSLKCPISLKLYVDPVTSEICHHSYSKDAIMAMFVHKMVIDCPVGGCSRKLRKTDLVPDNYLAGRVQRYIDRQSDQNEEEFDELDE
ncbi:zinc-finger of the MIZ type in Nse subunit-domain-containing protein [Lipomyces arxii]|uniref:zinc-finger of the MIZ type in Nse subunit-domain-containing protein n=1 Tax=Lipomyces arxii TaxID=56418 RepID=UPI0034CFECD9